MMNSIIFKVLFILTIVSIRATASAQDWSVHGYPVATGDHKFPIARSDVLFSPRWTNRTASNGNVALSAQDYIDEMNNYNAQSIVWHYAYSGSRMLDDSLIYYSSQLGVSANFCALPVLTRIPENALQDSDGNPVPQLPSTITFHGDIRTQGFRNEVSAYVAHAAASGCRGFQQDNPYHIYTCRTGQYCLTRDGGVSDLEVREAVRDYYNWLEQEILYWFGRSVPMSFNKSWQTEFPNNSSYTEIVPYFDVSMSEVDLHHLYPESLFKGIHLVNNLSHNMTTIGVLRDTSTLRNRRFISTFYALGAHPVVPFDVFIASGAPRFDGYAPRFTPYFQLVQDNASLFDGQGLQDVFIRHWQNTVGDVAYRGHLNTADNEPNQIAALMGGSANQARVLHVVNWQVANSPRDFEYYIDKSAIPYTPSGVLVHRPGLSSIQGQILDAGDGRWLVIVPSVDIWGVAEIQGY